MNEEIKVAFAAMQELIDVTMGEKSEDEKVSTFLSEELQTVFFKIYLDTYTSVLQDKSPLLALIGSIDSKTMAIMMLSAFTQGLTSGYFIGKQKQPETYADSIVHEYCQSRGVDFAKVVENWKGEL